MDKYQEALNFIYYENNYCSELSDCEECDVKNQCKYYLARKTLQEACDKAKKWDEKSKKETPKKVLVDEHDVSMGTLRFINCPTCEKELHFGWNKPEKNPRCPKCGQKLDWSEI